MAYLVPSLVDLRREIDTRWPNRDRRTDGWLRWPSAGKSFGHNPDSAGRVHAMDVDRDGIDPDWIVNNIYRGGGILWYIIWNRRLWSNTYNWVPYNYHGASPHTDHMHIEVYHTSIGRLSLPKWGIHTPGVVTFGSAPAPTEWGAADYLTEVQVSGDAMRSAGYSGWGYGGLIGDVRRL